MFVAVASQFAAVLAVFYGDAAAAAAKPYGSLLGACCIIASIASAMGLFIWARR